MNTAPTLTPEQVAAAHGAAVHGLTVLAHFPLRFVGLYYEKSNERHDAAWLMRECWRLFDEIKAAIGRLDREMIPIMPAIDRVVAARRSALVEAYGRSHLTAHAALYAALYRCWMMHTTQVEVPADCPDDRTKEVVYCKVRDELWHWSGMDRNLDDSRNVIDEPLRLDELVWQEHLWLTGDATVVEPAPICAEGRERVELAVEKLGRDAKPDSVIKEACIAKSAGRQILRVLEDEGRYSGFAKRRHTRTASRR